MSRNTQLALTVAMGLGWALAAQAAGIRTEQLVYRAGDIEHAGYVAYPDSGERHPAVLVVHEWMGLGPYAKRRAEELAALGYVALAADMYGGGRVAKDVKEAQALSGALKQGDRAEMRRRAAAALAALKAFRLTDTNRVAAIGYCFGGTTVLELARAGADLEGVVSFHGGLDTAAPAAPGAIRAAVLACHGADDPYVPKSEVEGFQDEMRKAGVDWQFIAYSGAVHSFTNPDAGNDPARGAAYNARADRRSWALMQSFLREALAP